MYTKVMILCLSFMVFFSCSKKNSIPPERKVLVEVEKAKSATIPIFIPAFGHFVAYNSVDIKAQVEGVLQEIHYTEGAMIKEGEPLVTIDPRPYQAKLNLAIAERAQNLAQYNFAKEKVERYAGLVSDNYVSILNFHEYETQMENLFAAIQKNDAQIDLAKINLDYCFIKAPFTGLCGKKKFDIGNLVTNNGDTLVTIKQLDPIYVDFSIPERDFFRLMRHQEQGNLSVNIEFPDYPDCKFTAKLIVVNNEIDSNTGMIPLRAEIQNPQGTFWPGQFIRTNLILQEKENAVVIPMSARNFGQKGQYVFVLNDKDIAEYRACTFGETLPDDQVEVIFGVSAGERVISNGQINVSPGIHVTVQQEKDTKDQHEVSS